MTIGELALTDVQLTPTGSLIGTLPTGLCPGTYAATVIDQLGRRVTGGQLNVTGQKSLAVSDSVAHAAITLNGRDQVLRLPLPIVQIHDTTCGTDDWRLIIAVDDLKHESPSRRPLVPRSVVLDGQRGAIPLAAAVGPDRQEAVAVISRVTAAGNLLTLHPAVEVIVPANAYIGQYSTAVLVRLVQGP